MSLLPFSKFIIHGISMLPTLKPGNQVISLNWFVNPKIGELVVVSIEEKFMIKRVERLENNKVFVVGDNLNESTDSRSFGSLNKDQIIGKVIFTIT